MSNMSGEDGPPPNVEHEFFNEGDDSLISNTAGIPEDSSSSDDDYLPPLRLKYRILFFFFLFLELNLVYCVLLKLNAYII